MRFIFTLSLVAFFSLGVLSLSGCGKKSPLTLPDTPPNNQVNSAQAADPSLRLIAFQELK